MQESNTRIFSLMRSTRDVVIKLRKSLVATNAEIKSLNRSKETLEKALEQAFLFLSGILFSFFAPPISSVFFTYLLA